MVMVSKDKAKPFLRWVGGKSQLLEQLYQFIPKEFEAYYEPFVGGGAMFFSLSPKKATINDLNRHLIALYRDVKINMPALSDELNKIQHEFTEIEKDADRQHYYYTARSEYNQLEDSVKKSALLIFLNKACFNGVYRENPKGEFNVPFGLNNTNSIYNIDVLQAASHTLQNARLMSTNYEDSLKQAKQNDFIYFDPPYWPISKTSNFTGYVASKFTQNEQFMLKRVIDDLTKKGCYVMLSNSATAGVEELYSGYTINYVQANRFINCKPGGRGKISEVVITNY